MRQGESDESEGRERGKVGGGRVVGVKVQLVGAGRTEGAGGVGGAVLLKRTVGSIMVLKHNSVSNILPPPPQIFLPRWFRPPGVRPPPPTEGGRRYVEFPLTVTPDSDRSGEACCCEAFGTDTDESEAISICRTQRPMRRRLRFYFFGGRGVGGRPL